jgi:hypothetical protein
MGLVNNDLAFIVGTAACFEINRDFCWLGSEVSSGDMKLASEFSETLSISIFRCWIWWRHGLTLHLHFYCVDVSAMCPATFIASFPNDGGRQSPKRRIVTPDSCSWLPKSRSQWPCGLRINAHTANLEWDSNPRLQRSSERRQFMPVFVLFCK